MIKILIKYDDSYKYYSIVRLYKLIEHGTSVDIKKKRIICNIYQKKASESKTLSNEITTAYININKLLKVLPFHQSNK